MNGITPLVPAHQRLPNVEPLLRCEWQREALNLADNPLQFVVHELGAIVERAPDGLKLEINTARKITVAIFVE